MTPAQNGPYSIQNLERFASFMDDRFRIPVLNTRVGWDFIIGLIPVAGDLLTAVASAYILVGAFKYRVRKGTIARMLLNIVIDLVVGAVPLLGDLLDASFRSNKKNIKLLLDALQSQQEHSNLHNPKR